jgi:hypothetical protein
MRVMPLDALATAADGHLRRVQQTAVPVLDVLTSGFEVLLNLLDELVGFGLDVRGVVIRVLDDEPQLGIRDVRVRRVQRVGAWAQSEHALLARERDVDDGPMAGHVRWP